MEFGRIFYILVILAVMRLFQRGWTRKTHPSCNCRFS